MNKKIHNLLIHKGLQPTWPESRFIYQTPEKKDPPKDAAEKTDKPAEGTPNQKDNPPKDEKQSAEALARLKQIEEEKKKAEGGTKQELGDLAKRLPTPPPKGETASDTKPPEPPKTEGQPTTGEQPPAPSAKIQENTKKQTENTAEMSRLMETNKTRRQKEAWIANNGNPDGIVQSGIDAATQEIINKQVEDKFSENVGKLEPELKAIVDKNDAVLKQAAKLFILDHFKKNGRSSDKTTDYVKGELKNSLLGFFQSMNDIFKSKKYPQYAKAEDLLKAFSDFTKLDFINQGVFQPTGIKTLLELEKSQYPLFVEDFKKYLDLGQQNSQLEADKANEQAGTLSPEEMLKQGKIPFSPVRIQFTADLANVNQQLTEKIPQAMPANLNPELKNKVKDLLVANLNTQKPNPGETFELNEKGEWRKVDTASEQQQKKAVETAVAQQVQQAGGEAPTENTGLLNGGFAAIIKGIMDFINKIIAMFTGNTPKNEVPEDLSKSLAEWTDLTPEEETGIVELNKELYTNFITGKTPELSIKPQHLATLFKNPIETRKILELKKKNPDKNWKQFINEQLSPDELNILRNPNDLKAEEISSLLLSKDGGAVDASATAPKATQAPSPTETQPPTAEERNPTEDNPKADQIMAKINESPLKQDLERILEKLFGKPIKLTDIDNLKLEAKITAKENPELENFFNSPNLTKLQFFSGFFEIMLKKAKEKFPDEQAKIDEINAEIAKIANEVLAAPKQG